MRFTKPYWKYINGFTDNIKEKACERIKEIENQFNHDKEHRELITQEYIELCVSDGLFESTEDFEGAITAYKIRQTMKPE